MVPLADFKNADDLRQMIKEIGENLVKKDPMNFVVRNCTERMLKMLKVECSKLNIMLG